MFSNLISKVVTYIRALGQNLPTSVIHVRQYKTRQSAFANYDVQMGSVEDSEKIRAAYGAFWRRPKAGQTAPPIPQLLSEISISISHTFATRIRCKILKQMAKLHQAANPELSAFVTSYLPRPNLKVRRPGGRVESYNYVEAVKRFGHHLTQDFLASEADYARSTIGLDYLTPYFLVLSPDHVLPAQPPTPATGASKGSKRALEQVNDSATKKTRGRGGQRGGRGRGKATNPAAATPQAVPGSSINQFAALTSPDEDNDRSFVASQAESIAE